MTIRLTDTGWREELIEASQMNFESIRIICPFIQASVLDSLLAHKFQHIQVITRFNLDDFASGVSDIESLRKLLNKGASVRGIRHLHTKLYLFGDRRTIITSANLTEAALSRNHEFGMVSEDQRIFQEGLEYFNKLWQRSKPDLKPEQIDNWSRKITQYRIEGGRIDQQEKLKDYGADIGIIVPTTTSDVPQAFIKFLGTSGNRKELSYSTIKVIDSAGCHWALCYPANKRPKSVTDGAVMYIARMTKNPNDMRIFGRAIGNKHMPERDNATDEDIKQRNWKQKWPRYIRVYGAEFIAGTVGNGVSLNEMMDTLQSDSFRSTQDNRAKGKGNTNPRRAYAQQPSVELSVEGQTWIEEKIQEAFGRHGKIPRHEIENLDCPNL